MNLEELENIFLSKPGAVKDFPFGDDVTVFKVMDKMFGLIIVKEGLFNINLKYDPIDAKAYREIYNCVIPGYHMNKKHWNTIILDGSMEEDIFIGMVNDSYELVVSKLSKKDRASIS